MIRIVTDSSSQIPPELAERYGISVVPIVVNVNGVEYREGVDLDADAFYRFWDDGEPDVSTSQPSPGDFARSYAQLVAEGATEILSIHVGSAFSGTSNSARLAADGAAIPIRVVDTGTLSFGISCCVWEAAEALLTGADLDAAAAAADAVVPHIVSVTTLQALEFFRGQGRMTHVLPDSVDGVPVIAVAGDDTQIIGDGRSVDELAVLMVDRLTASDDDVRVAVGIADATAAPFSEAMEKLLAERSNVVDLIRYWVGPSVGAFTGPGVAGGFAWPAT